MEGNPSTIASRPPTDANTRIWIPSASGPPVTPAPDVTYQPTDLERRAVAILEGGVCRILRGKWLLSQPEDYVLQRHQDLPPEAFVPPEKAVELFQKGFGLVGLSYGWLTRQHPDPSGFYFRIVKQWLAKYCSVETWGISEVGVFGDFAALPQNGLDGTKTEEEEATRKKGLQVMHLLYGSAKALVLQLKMLPENPSLGLALRQYDARGWCFFEATVASMLKPTNMLLDLSLNGIWAALIDPDDTQDLLCMASADRKPPIAPDEMKEELRKRTFTNGRDPADVEVLYEQFFTHATTTAQELVFSNQGFTSRSGRNGWGEGEMKQFAHTLRYFRSCQELHLIAHGFSDEGLGSLVAEVPALAKLRYLDLRRCRHFSGFGFQASAGCEVPAVEALNLGETDMDDSGPRVLAASLHFFPQLRELSFFCCSFIRGWGFDGLSGQVLALEKLDLSYTGIDEVAPEGLTPPGLGVLLEQLPAFTKLRFLDFQGCKNISTNGIDDLTDILSELPALEELWIPDRLEHTDEGEILAEAWADSGRAIGDLVWGD